MDKIDNKNQAIKLTFLEINPPINELIKNKEEINIIFQGNDNFYDFKKYLSSKIPIQLNRYKKSLIMTLLKSNNILATGLFTVRPGEQNVIFNYEDKKRIISKKAVNINNLLDCIKIKILCEYDNNNNNTNNNSNNKDKDKNYCALNTTNNYLNINENKNNDSMNKYIPKVNLVKTNHLKNKNNNIGKKIFDKKKKLLGNYYSNNSMKKNNNFINSSQEFCVGGELSSFLTEEMNNNYKFNNNLNTSEIKKLNPYCSSKINLNMPRKTEIDTSSKSKGIINKAKSKNYFSTIKKYSKQSFTGQIKMNNSSLNLINQNNKYTSIDNNDNHHLNNNLITNKNIIKPTISFNKNTNKRNINSNKTNTINHKNLKTSLDSFISGQIIEHVDKSKKDNIITNINNSDKKNNVNIIDKKKNNIGNVGINNNIENKKRKFNTNNITQNSVSTAGTKKNELEFSINSIQDGEDKFNMNKNGFLPFTNRINNERLQQKMAGANTVNRNNIKHNFNKSLCHQSSFTDKIFNENEILNLNENININNNSISKSYDKLQKEDNGLNNLNSNEINKTNEENKDTNNININNNDVKNEINEFNNEEEEEVLEDDNFSKIKEDFNLLYNEEYIKQINEDLLKLEIELFIEKMSELFSAYHIQMDEKILENQIIKGDYDKNIKNYLLYMKLDNKLQFVKAQKDAKKFNLKEKDINLNKQNFTNVNVNMNELNIFKLIFPDESKSKKLKKIITIILKKQENNELLGEKLKMFIK